MSCVTYCHACGVFIGKKPNRNRKKREMKKKKCVFRAYSPVVECVGFPGNKLRGASRGRWRQPSPAQHSAADAAL